VDVCALRAVASTATAAATARATARRGQRLLVVVWFIGHVVHFSRRPGGGSLDQKLANARAAAERRKRWGLRRFGFRGLSHAHAARRTAELLGVASGARRGVGCSADVDQSPDSVGADIQARLAAAG
jgi:hypothetical protein